MLSLAQKIKILLIEKEKTASQIAKKIGVNRAMITHVLKGRSKSVRVKKAIADELGVPYESLWDE